MRWIQTNRNDPRAVDLANRHYSRQNPDAKQFGKPGRSLVFITPEADAVWLTSWPFKEYVDHDWYPGAWECSLFRNESGTRSSDLILDAIAATRMVWGDPPDEGMITFVDPAHVPGTFRRSPGGRRLDWGYSYRRAGFDAVGWTKAGKPGAKRVLRLRPELMPPAEPGRLDVLPLFSGLALV